MKYIVSDIFIYFYCPGKSNYQLFKIKHLTQIEIFFSDTKRCLRYLAFWGTQSNFIFIGDSRIHEFYQGFINHLQPPEHGTENPYKSIPNNLTFIDAKLKIRVQYLWYPTVNNKMIDLFRQWHFDEKPPSVILVGSGLAMIKSANFSTTALKEFTVNITRLVQPVDKLSSKFTRILWALQAPVNEEKMSADEKITNEQIDLYNKAAVDVSNF